ncbi:MAG: type I-U CRISPR-associated protein Csb2 [Zavarzinella sp.]
MEQFVCFTIRFLDPAPRYHGSRDEGEPEWPPSPLRLYQAMVDAAATRWKGTDSMSYSQDFMFLFENIGTPIIISPNTHTGLGYRIAVPNNDLDSPAKIWARGRDPIKPQRPIDLKTMKQVRPTHLLGDTLYYLYPLPSGECPHLDVLKAAARSITHLGWGIDMVAADASIINEEEAAKLPGHRWRVVPSGGVPLRVPKPGTLNDLVRKHKEFLGRVSEDGFKPVAPLRCFDVKNYYSPTVKLPAPKRSMAAFEIHRTIDDQEENIGKSRFRAYHHARRLATVAGMVRHACGNAVKNQLSEEIIKTRILGHGDEKNGQSTSDDRYMFLPLPSVQPVVGIGAIRRVLIVGTPGMEIASLRRQLNGQELIDEKSGQAVAMLSGVGATDNVFQSYLNEAQTWATVTPVILPGFDDPDRLRNKLKKCNTAEEQKRILTKLNERIISLIWKAFEQAGWQPDALQGAVVEYRRVGWFKGLELADHYEKLPPVNYPRYHVKVKFARPVQGPIAIGAGRYRGFGLFARYEE